MSNQEISLSSKKLRMKRHPYCVLRSASIIDDTIIGTAPVDDRRAVPGRGRARPTAQRSQAESPRRQL